MGEQGEPAACGLPPFVTDSVHLAVSVLPLVMELYGEFCKAGRNGRRCVSMRRAVACRALG